MSFFRDFLVMLGGMRGSAGDARDPGLEVGSVSRLVGRSLSAVALPFPFKSVEGGGIDEGRDDGREDG